MNQVSKADFEYFNRLNKKIETKSSVLVSSSPYLNHAGLRAIVAQEMLRRNGPDLQSTAYITEYAAIIHEIEDTPAVDAMIAREKAKNPELARWFDARILSYFTADQTRDYPPGTLGGIIHKFITSSGYQLDYFFQGMKVETDYDYYKKERTFTHDIEHMVTGFETDFASEMGLLYANTECFFRYFSPELACEFNRVNAYLIAKSVMKTIFYYPAVATEMLEATRLGIEMGRAWKKPLMLINWNEHLDWTIADIREEYNVVGSPESGRWTWTTDAVIG